MLSSRLFRGLPVANSAGRRQYSQRTRIEGVVRMAKLKTIPSWTEVNRRDAIYKSFKFANFRQAWHFMRRIAEVADKWDHHPEWFNVFNRVEITLTTHEAGGVSSLDVTFAQKIEEIYQEVSSGKSVATEFPAQEAAKAAAAAKA